MRPDSLSTLLDYLQGLGQRHQEIQTSVVALPEQFQAPNAKDYPLLLVEPDPFVEGWPTTSANLYRVAFFVNVREVRTDSKANAELTTYALQLCDELLQQAQDESKVELSGAPTYTLHYGTADGGLSSGVRCEQAFILPKAVNRRTLAKKFQPKPTAATVPFKVPSTVRS